MIHKRPIDAFFGETSDTPTAQRVDENKSTENRKISYWLEKLHIQGERRRKEENMKENKSPDRVGNHSQTDPILDEKDQSLTESGIDENTKNVAKKSEEDAQIVNDLVKKSNRNIISISSFFPLDLFPSTIEVEESKVFFKFKQFLSAQSHSLDIKDISNVFIETSLFFASLQVVSRTFVQNEIKIGKLNKAKAIKVKNIIEGLRTFAENDINTSNYEIDELILKIGEFHTDKSSE